MFYLCSRSRLKKWSRETRSCSASAHSFSSIRLNLVVPSRFRRRGFLSTHRQSPPSIDQSRVDQVAQSSTDGVHHREFAGTGPVIVLEVALVTGADYIYFREYTLNEPIELQRAPAFFPRPLPIVLNEPV